MLLWIALAGHPLSMSASHLISSPKPFAERQGSTRPRQASEWLAEIFGQCLSRFPQLPDEFFWIPQFAKGLVLAFNIHTFMRSKTFAQHRVGRQESRTFR